MRRFIHTLKMGARFSSKGMRLVFRDPLTAALALRMTGWVGAVTLMIKFMSLPKVLRLAAPRSSHASTGDADYVQARLARTLNSVLAVDLLFLKPTCWKRAIVLHRYLALNGIRTRVMFGVRKEEGGALAGHAWLEADGKYLLEAQAPDYRVTYSFPT